MGPPRDDSPLSWKPEDPWPQETCRWRCRGPNTVGRETAGDSKNNQRKNSTAGLEEGGGKGRELAWRAAPLTKRLQMALTVLVRARYKRKARACSTINRPAWPCSQESGLRSQERAGGSPGPLSPLTVCTMPGGYLYPHPKANKDTEPQRRTTMYS